MYFEDRMSRRSGLPWFDSRTEWEKQSDEYFGKLEAIVEQVDDVQSNTTFITGLWPDEFDNGYQYALARLREMREYLLTDDDNPLRDTLLENLYDAYNELVDLCGDAVLYDGETSDEDDDDLDAFEDDDDDDDDPFGLNDDNFYADVDPDNDW